MRLIARQQAFLAEVAAADDAALSPASSGMAIYRNAYRARLLSALETGFELTRRWTGEDAFAAVACHHVLATPPGSWTLDAYGATFPALLAELFADDPEVAELAWLEWHRQQAFAAPDRPTLDPAQLATAGLSEEDWANLRVTMAAGFAALPVTTDCTALWDHLTGDAAPGFQPSPVAGQAVLVWRVGFSPRHRPASRLEHEALAGLAAGQPLGVIAAATDPAQLGGWLAQWLSEGIFATASAAQSPEAAVLAES